MRSLRSFSFVAALLLLALPAAAAETVTLTLDASSPRPLGSGLTAASGDYFLVNAEGAVRRVTGYPISEGWFDPSGLGRLRRSGQVFGDMPFGSIIGTFDATLGGGFHVGDIATWPTQGVDIGLEFKVGLNMSSADQSTLEGDFKVHVTRFTANDIVATTVRIDPNSPQPLGTSIFATSADEKFLVLAQGTTRVITNRPITEGWFDASGLGRLNRTGQVFPYMGYGCVIGTFYDSLSNGFYVGDIATWDTQPVDLGREFKVGLNMDADDQLGMDGFVMVHVAKISNLSSLVAVRDPQPGSLPDRDAAVLMENQPNPFNPLTTIRFALARPQQVRVAIVGLTGEQIVDLARGTYPAGTHELEWNGQDGSGQPVASGTYLVRLETDSGVRAQKLTLVR